jgi:hypothetical protein
MPAVVSAYVNKERTMSGVTRFLIISMLAAGIGLAPAQELPGKSPVSSGTIHSSPERPDKPIVDPESGLVWSTNPSTVDLPNQPSVGGRDPIGGDPTRPGDQGSLWKRP